MSRALLPGRMMLMTALVDRHFREARVEHRGRFVPSGDEPGNDRIDIVEIEGGVPASIYLRGRRFRKTFFPTCFRSELPGSSGC
jgi:hypothetical protein